MLLNLIYFVSSFKLVSHEYFVFVWFSQLLKVLFTTLFIKQLHFLIDHWLKSVLLFKLLLLLKKDFLGFTLSWWFTLGNVLLDVM